MDFPDAGLRIEVREEGAKSVASLYTKYPEDADLLRQQKTYMLPRAVKLGANFDGKHYAPHSDEAWWYVEMRNPIVSGEVSKVVSQFDEGGVGSGNAKSRRAARRALELGMVK